MAPSHIESQAVEGTLLPGCSTQMSSIMQLLSSASKVSAIGDSYLVLPADTVPMKTFTKTYMQFCSLPKVGDTDRTSKSRRTTASFCIAPYSQWIAKGGSSSDSSKNTTTTTTTTTTSSSSIANSLTSVKQVFGSWIHARGTSGSVGSLAGRTTSNSNSNSSSSNSNSNSNSGVDLMIPRHDPWMHLNHIEVQKILSQRADACNGDTTAGGTADDRVNWWFYQALSDPTTRLRMTEQEQGNCHTYYVTFNHTNHFTSSSSSNLNKMASMVNGSVVSTRWGIKMSPSTTVRTLDRAIMDPSVYLIADLIHSPNFFFARGFRGNEPGHHIVGMAQNYSIQSGFHLLQIFGNHQKKHHNRERGKGDNGGLKVLIVSCDDREMKDRLEDDDYVSMTAVLVHDYAMHHGYDFMKLTGTTTYIVTHLHIPS